MSPRLVNSLNLQTKNLHTRSMLISANWIGFLGASCVWVWFFSLKPDAQGNHAVIRFTLTAVQYCQKQIYRKAIPIAVT